MTTSSPPRQIPAEAYEHCKLSHPEVFKTYIPGEHSEAYNKRLEKNLTFERLEALVMELGAAPPEVINALDVIRKYLDVPTEAIELI